MSPGAGAPLPAEALRRWRAALDDAGWQPLRPVELLALADAVGRVLAAPVTALHASPPHTVAAMDGIAVLAADTGALRLAPGSFDLVDTGDVVPVGRDAVVVREEVTYTAGAALLTRAVVAGRHVRAAGEDVAAGEVVLSAGQRLRPVDVALAAAAGHLEVPVRRQPHVVVLPTGDEVLPLGSLAPGSAPGPGQVLDTNSLMLAALAQQAGGTAQATPVVPDDPAALARAVRAAAAEADLVIVGAGSSAGRDDHTAAVLAAVGRVAVHGVAVRPGHPVVLGVVDGTPVLGSPGYPVSAALTFELLVLPLLAAMLGAPVPTRARATARLEHALVSPTGVDEWLRVELTRSDGGLCARVLRGGAGALASLARADALLLVPAGSDGHLAGASVEVELVAGRSLPTLDG